MYEVLDKDTIKFENLPHSSATKRSYVTKKIAAGGNSVHSLQVENGQSVAHNEEKVKGHFFMFLMFLCQHGHISAKTRKGTFSLSQMNNVELARTLSWRELEIADTEL